MNRLADGLVGDDTHRDVNVVGELGRGADAVEARLQLGQLHDEQAGVGPHRRKLVEHLDDIRPAAQFPLLVRDVILDYTTLESIS